MNTNMGLQKTHTLSRRVEDSHHHETVRVEQYIKELHYLLKENERELRNDLGDKIGSDDAAEALLECANKLHELIVTIEGLVYKKIAAGSDIEIGLASAKSLLVKAMRELEYYFDYWQYQASSSEWSYSTWSIHN